MNSTTSIHAPPDDLWRELAIDGLIDKYNQENAAPATRRKPNPATVASSSTPVSEGTFGRFSRAVASFFSGTGFSSLGKRKAGSDNAEKDDRKEQAKQAYEQAKEMGLLPAPKVFVRPIAKPRKSGEHFFDNPIDYI